MTLTNFPNGISSFGVPVVGGIGGIPLTGTWYFCDPANGADGQDGTSPETAVATLYRAHALMTAGKNDVCVLIGNGAASGTARLSTALAQSIDSTVTAGTLVWSKNACHLIGVTAPTMNFQRARIAPPSGTYTVTTFGSANFVTVSAAGCIFQNFSLFNGFSTGGANQICWTDTGGRNYYNNVNFGGMADAGSANSTGSRSLKIGAAGTGENTFVNCVIGIDTVTRTAANASLEFAGGTPRNAFYNCTFPFQGNTAGILGIVVTGSAMDRTQLFDNCKFINNVGSTSTTMAAVSTIAASSGGLLLMHNCSKMGITDWGTDANSLAQTYINMVAATADNGGTALASAT
jgi:hypothetical protein